MPGTASSQIQSRSTSKARPSANVRAANLLANTPVLFRLPAIANATAQDLAASISANVASLPTATLSAVALSNAQATAAQAEVASEAMVDSQDSLQRTWWEHWSSGIVLIVLLIALATASIFAWQGSGKSNSKLMADTKQENESSSDLSNIEVPKLTNPKLEIPVSTKLNSAAEKLEASSFQNSTTLQKSADDLDTSLILSEALSGNPNASATNQNSTLATSTPAALPAPYATASLQQPVVKPQEPLFKDDGLVPAKPNISAQPASTATQLNSTQSADPSVWDSSKTSSQQAAKPLTLELSDTGSSGAATSSLAQATERSNNTSNRVSATLTSQSVTIASPTDPLLVPTNMQFAAKTATPELDQAALFASYRQYATTDMSAPAESPGNRYKTAANVGSQAQVAGAATGTAATTVGYTQQPTQQQPIQQQPRTQAIIQPSPGSYNYTLQPTQNFAPNAGSQSQYPTQQYPAQQYPAQQYQIPQYQNGQYQYQQYLPQSPSQPLYAPQAQPSTQYPNSMPTPSSQGQSSQYPGAQVPYNGQQVASQPNALQLPPGPIGGYGYATPSTSNGTASGVPRSTSSSGPANPGAQNSLGFPTLQ